MGCLKKPGKQLTLWQCTGKVPACPPLPRQARIKPAPGSKNPGKGGKQTSLWQFLSKPRELPLPQPQPTAEKEGLPSLPGEASEEGTAIINNIVEQIPPSFTNLPTKPSVEPAPPSVSPCQEYLPELHPHTHSLSPPACLFEDGKCVQHKCTLLQKYLKTEKNEDDSDRKAYNVKRIWICPVINLAKITKPLNFTSGEAKAPAQGLILRKAKIRKRR